MARENEGADVDAQLARECLAKVLSSATMKNSPMLQNFLRFVALRQLQGRGEEIKESLIARELFGRGEGSDNTVRVHASRLRVKLRAYYEGEGSEDRVLIELPVGGYVPRFRLRAPEDAEGEEWLEPAGGRARWNRPRMAAVAAGILAAFALGWGIRTLVPAGGPPPAPEIVREFWSPLLGPGNSTVIVCPTPAGESETGCTAAVHVLTRLFAVYNSPLNLKRSQQFTLGEFPGSHVIYAGPPAGENFLADLGHTPYFDFRKEPYAIENLKPVPGEQKLYGSGTQTASDPQRSTYALITRMPGMGGDRVVLILSGLTAQGTEAAARFLTSEATLRKLEESLRPQHRGESRFPAHFQTIIRADYPDGEVTNTEYVTGRVLDAP